MESDQSVLVPYKGAALKEMTVYQVQVSVWDNCGELGQVTGNFETGLMREENWKRHFGIALKMERFIPER